MNIDLTNRTAIVCGSSQGIGLAAARELAELGCNVTLLARNPESLSVATRGLADTKKQQHNFLVADFSQPDSVSETVQNWLNAGNSAEILVNNTGGPPGGLACESTPEQFLNAFSAHLICNQVLTTALLPGMRARSYGRIINIISTSVKQPIPGLGVSNTIRGAVANWAKTLASELGQYGITVNNVLPGTTSTARLDSIIESMAQKSSRGVEQVANEMRESVPAKRFADPSEVGAAVAFLASPAASYINGINLPVDGGRTRCL